MKVTKTEEHGLRLAMTLAKEKRQLTISELSEREGLSEALIAKLLGMLRKGGIVKAERGRRGGYELAARPENITVSMVIKALGPELFRGCLETPGKVPSSKCTHISNCGLRPVWCLLEDRIKSVLEKVSLLDLIKEEKEVMDKIASF